MSESNPKNDIKDINLSNISTRLINPVPLKVYEV